MASGVAIEIATFGGYTFALGFHEAAGLGLMASGCAMATYHAQDIKVPSISWKNTNPFDGSVDGGTIVVDPQGNAIPVHEGNWLTGSRDGKWIQEMKPGLGPKGEPTGKRKDGGGHPPPKHTDARANEPHAHVPGITNPDGTDWLPIKK